MNTAARALYVQQGWDQNVDYMKSRYVDRVISKKNQEYVVWVVLVARSVQDQYVSYTWHF